MNEQQFQEELIDIFELLDTFAELDEETITIEKVSTFEKAGILTVTGSRGRESPLALAAG